VRKTDLRTAVVHGVRSAGLHPGSPPTRLRVRPRRANGETFALPLLVLPHRSDVMIVSLHSAIPRGRLPRFEWLRSMHDRPESQLYLSDPTLHLSPDLTNGFFVGDDTEDLTPRLARVVRRTAAAIGAEHVVLLGYSSGGFAAVRIGSHLPDSVALTFAARSSLGDRPLDHTTRFFDAVFPGQGGFDSLHPRLGARLSLLDTVPVDSTQRVVWVQNTGDVEHLEHQFLPLARHLGLPVTGGASASGSVHLVPTFYGHGHFTPPIEYWTRCLDAAVAYARTGTFAAPAWDEDVTPPPVDAPTRPEVGVPTIESCGPAPGLPRGFAALVGRAEEDVTVSVYLDGAFHRTVRVDPAGRWRATPRSLPGRQLVVRAFAHRHGVGRSADATARFTLVE
jgi:hypothetical protein